MFKNLDLLNSWPGREAKKLLANLNGKVPAKGNVLFESGFGPSGPPHIGTVIEVLRTKMVEIAFNEISDIPTTFQIFSDDRDALRTAGIIQPDYFKLWIGHPLYKIPVVYDTWPFDKRTMSSINNFKLISLLQEYFNSYDSFLLSSSEHETTEFDEIYLKILEKYDDIMSIMLPTLREERKATYSPFMPFCPITGKILQVPIKKISKKEISYINDEGKEIVIAVNGNTCKLQWKVDWAARWVRYDVNYEMAGKDLTDSYKLSGKIAKILGGKRPTGFIYELFLDDEGKKISKSKDNGFPIDKILESIPSKSIEWFAFQKPERARKFSQNMIVDMVDNYVKYMNTFEVSTPVMFSQNFSKYLTIFSMFGEILDEHLYLDSASQSDVEIDLFLFAKQYYNNFEREKYKARAPTEKEKEAIKELIPILILLDKNDVDEEQIQFYIYEIGKKYYPDNLRDWFKALYEILLGKDNGPRFGGIIEMISISKFCELLREKIK